MRMMVAGMGARSANHLFSMTEQLVVPHNIVPDWTQLEDVVAEDEPDLIALYLGQHPGQQLAMVRKLLSLHPRVAVIALCDTPNPDLTRMISEAGCADMVVISECPEDMHRALSSLMERGSAEVVDGRVLTVLGAKGGVGTTTVACNLADALTQQHPDRRTILLDLNLYLGDVAVHLDMAPQPSAIFFLQRASALDAVQLLQTPSRHERGFWVMALDGDLEQADPVSAEQVVFLIERLRQRYDHVVVDCGTNLTESSMAACSTADHRLVITTEQLASRMGARRRISALQVLDPDRRSIQIVVNRSLSKTPEQLAQLEAFIGVSIVDTISNAWSEASGALERGQTLLTFAPQSTVTADIQRLGEKLAGQRDQEDRRTRAFFDFFR